MATTAVVAFGSQAFVDSQQEARVSGAEAGLSQFAGRAAMVALGSSSVQTVDLGFGSAGDGALRVTHGGRIEVTTGGGTEIVNRSLGTVEYRVDGQVVAYQSGGVWRRTGNGSAMVSPPTFHYRGGTLTLPVVVVIGSETGATASRVTVREGPTAAPVGPGRIDGETVTITITSRYYEGWAEFLRERVAGVSVRVDHANGSVSAVLGDEEVDSTLDEGIIAQGDVSIDTPKDVDTEVVTSGSLTGKKTGSLSCAAGTGTDCVSNEPIVFDELDGRIDRQIVAARNGLPAAGVGGGGKTLSSGAYYSDGFNLDGGDLTLDVGSGNVTLFVDGNVGLDNNRIRVVNGSGTDAVVKVYTTGDVAMAKGGAGVSVFDDNASRFQLYGTSETHFAMGQTNTVGFTGVVYAPRDDPAVGTNDAVAEYGLTSATAACPGGIDVCLGQGSGTVKGAIVSGPVSVQQAASFDYDENVASVSPTLPTAGDAAPPSLTYLHVSINRIEVEGPEVIGTPTGATFTPTPAPTPTATPPGTPAPTATLTATPGGNQAPAADFTYSRKGNSDNVDLDGTPSPDPDGSVASYEWDVDDDGIYEASGPTVANAKVPAGTTVTLRVTDGDGATDTVRKTVP